METTKNDELVRFQQQQPSEGPDWNCPSLHLGWSWSEQKAQMVVNKMLCSKREREFRGHKLIVHSPYKVLPTCSQELSSQQSQHQSKRCKLSSCNSVFTRACKVDLLACEVHTNRSCSPQRSVCAITIQKCAHALCAAAEEQSSSSLFCFDRWDGVVGWQ